MDGSKLTPKQERFVVEYLLDLNATQAYRRAGYACKNDNAAAASAATLLRNPKIKKEIRVAREKQCARIEVKADDVLRELLRVAMSDPRKLFNKDGSLKSITELDDDSAATISSVEVFEEFEGTGKSRKLKGFTRKVRHWDKVAALDKLGKHLALFVERVRLEGGITIVEDEHWYDNDAHEKAARPPKAASPSTANSSEPGQK